MVKSQFFLLHFISCTDDYGFILLTNALRQMLISAQPPPPVLPAIFGSPIPPTQRKERLLNFFVDLLINVNFCETKTPQKIFYTVKFYLPNRLGWRKNKVIIIRNTVIKIVLNTNFVAPYRSAYAIQTTVA